MAITKINTPEIFDLGATNTALRLPSGSTASRPTNPTTGEWRYNTDDNYVEYWDGSAWFQIDYETVAPTCTTNTINYPTAVSAYYKMEDATDQTGNYNGTPTNVNFNVAGKFGNAGEFSGSSTYLNTNVPPSIFNTNTWSISLWLYQSNPNTFGYFLGTTDTGILNGFAMGYYSDGSRFDFITRNGSVTVGRWQGGTPTINTWTNLVIVNNNNSFTFYQDGSQASNYSTYTQPASGGTYSSTNNFILGRAGFYNTEGHHGKLDQVRIFPSALTAAQVTELYNEIQCAPTIVPSEHFNTNTYVGNGGTQTIDAKFNEAAAFNGSSSGISLNNTAFQLTTYSVSFWVNSSDYSTTGTTIYDGGLDNDGTYWGGIALGFSANKIFYYGGDVTGVGGSGFYTQTGTTTITNSTWYNVTLIVNGTSITGYINGVQDTGLSRTLGANIVYRGTPGFNLGFRSGSFGSFGYLNGKLDQVRIFNTALTASQVTDLYTNETTATAQLLDFPVGAGCIAAYELDGDASDVGGTYGGVPTNIGYIGLQFQPDFVWIKNRSIAPDHVLFDSIRGAEYYIRSNTTDSQNVSADATTLNSFDSNGFTISGATNTGSNGHNFVAWCFKGGGSAVSNTDGTITSQVSANQDAGFSIVKYTSNGSYTSSDTIGHGLSQAPDLVIWKPYSGTTSDWFVQYQFVDGSVDYLILNATDAKRDSASTYLFQSNVLVNYAGANGQNVIAYCFHSVEGFSKIGSYIGTNAPNNSIVTGFEPAFVMIKSTGATSGDWNIFDNKRNTPNPLTDVLKANTSGAETTEAALNISFNSNGFTLNGASGAAGTGQINSSGITYIFLAIAADPAPEPVLANSFDPVIYTGNGGAQNVTTSFQPDLVWIKNRNNSANSTWSHSLFDSVRTSGWRVKSDSTDAENNYSVYMTGFNSNGFSLSSTALNDSAGTYVAWNWKAAGIPAINQNGTMDSIVNANPAAGFSIVTLDKPNTNTDTYGHGLSQAPELIILKRTASADDWYVYSKDLGNTVRISLNSSAAKVTGTGVWGSTTPTSSVFTLQNQLGGAHVAYCFHSVSGYQKVGSYTGNNSSGGQTITGLGFNPRFLLVKHADAPASWRITDSARGNNTFLYPNLTNADDSNSGYISLITDGFRMNGLDSNASGTYIYLAIG